MQCRGRALAVVAVAEREARRFAKHVESSCASAPTSVKFQLRV